MENYTDTLAREVYSCIGLVPVKTKLRFFSTRGQNGIHFVRLLFFLQSIGLTVAAQFRIHT